MITIIDKDELFSHEDKIYCENKSWLLAFSNISTDTLISNVDTHFVTLKCQSKYMPMTINDAQYTNSYVVSPYTAFILYAREELVKINNVFIQKALSILLTSLGCLFKLAKVNKIIFINNYLLSTNLHLNIDPKNIEHITTYLKKHYKDHVFAFRSLNYPHNSTFINEFIKNQYHLMVSRQIYIFDHRNNPYFKKHNVIIDNKLLLKNDYRICSSSEIHSKDYKRIAELYSMLYLDKYSHHNPKFTEAFIKASHDKKLLTIFGLRNQCGILDGVIGFFTLENITTAPLVGYDTSLPQSIGLYRRLMAIAFKFSQDNNYCLNLSSGASQFKRLRGGIPHLEYTAIYYAHLPWLRRLFWKFVSILTNLIGRAILVRYKL